MSNIKINGKQIKNSTCCNHNISFESYINTKFDRLQGKIKLRKVYNKQSIDSKNIKSQEMAISTTTIQIASTIGIFAITSIAVGLNKLINYIKKQQNSPQENFWSNNKHAKVIVDNGIVTIKKINYRALMFRIAERYHENIIKIFDINYKPGDYKKYKNRRIAIKADMRIKDISFKEFFSLEVVTLLEYLSEIYDVPEYKSIIKQIIEKTHLNNLISIKEYKTPLSQKTKEEFKEYPPMKHQEEFIELYQYLKECMNLRGYILSFDQGLGKTLTGLCLGTNLNKDQFIIICPNTLTTVWADEICDKMNTYKNNHNKAIKDIMVVNDKTGRFTKSTNPKFIIVNNEAIEKAKPYINYSKNTIFIIDECQNFRYLNGQRWGFLIDAVKAFYEKNKNIDVLCMSGTHIKAKPSELSPVM